MHSTKLFKRIGSLLPLARTSSQALYKPYYFEKLSKGLFAQRGFNFFSTTTNAIETREQVQSEAKLLTEEFNLITRSDKFNMTLTLHTIEKYLNYISRLDNLSTLNQIQNSSQFQQFCSYIVANLDAFKSTTEISNITLFLLQAVRDPKTLNELVSHLGNYSQLFSLDAKFLNQVLPRLFVGNAGLTQKFLVHLKNNRSSLDVNDQIVLLDTANKLLAESGKINPGRRSAEFTNLINSSKAELLQQIDKLTPANLARLYEFIYQEQGNESVRDTIESRIVKGYTSLEASDIVRLLYVLYAANRQASHELWSLLEEQVIEKINEFSANDLVTVLGCFSSLEKGSEDLYMQIDRQIGFSHETLTLENIAPLVYCFAQSGNFRKKFFFLLSERINENLALFNVSHLVRIFWAYTTTSTLNKSMYTAIAENIVPKFGELKLDELDLILDCLVHIHDQNSPYLGLFVSRVQEIFNNTQNHKTLGLDFAYKLYLLNTKLQGELDQILPSVNKFILSKLDEKLTPETAAHIVQVGDVLGQNLDYVDQNRQVIAKCIEKLGEINQRKEELLEEDSRDEAEFILLNLKGFIN